MAKYSFLVLLYLATCSASLRWMKFTFELAEILC